jgi:chromosome partitioning protein
MRGWLKRITTPGSRRQAGNSENQAVVPDDNIERLADRLAAGDAPAGAMSAGHGETRIIAVCSQKGGVGKTTVAAHLGVRAAMAGQGPAVLVDTDPQGSLSEWWRERAEEDLPLSAIKMGDLANELPTLRHCGAAVAIIDTPPALAENIKEVINVADLVLIPARPSPHDLRAIGGTIDLVQRARKPFLFIVNGAANRAHITAECVAALSEHGRVAPVILYQRTEWAASMIDGRTVLETAGLGKSAREVADLWAHIYEQLAMREAA